MKFIIFIFLSLIVSILGLPRHKSYLRNLSDDVGNVTVTEKIETNKKFNYASTQSQIIFTNLLKDNIDIDGNNVFSPLGVSSILAILAEGARGDTYKEFENSLGYPVDKNDLRHSFKNVLNNFESRYLKDFDANPSFKIWFYIYKNNTVRDEFKDILRKCYSVEVKDIDNLDFNWNDPDTAPTESDDSFKSSSTNSKDIVNFEDLKKSEAVDKFRVEISGSESDKYIEKEASKFDAVVDDKQYVEVPIIKAEIAKETEEKRKENEVIEKIDHTEKYLIQVVDSKLGQNDAKSDAKSENISAANVNKKDDIVAEVLKVKNSNSLLEEKDSSKLPVLDDVSEKVNTVPEPIDLKVELNELKNEIPAVIQEINLEKDNSQEKRESSTLDLEKIIENKESEIAEAKIEDNETVSDEEKIDALRKEVSNVVVVKKELFSNDEPEKITVPIKKFDDEAEIMEAMESQIKNIMVPKARSLFNKEDVASALSANSITGRSKPSKTKMLLFNGLYYRGNWKYPFQELRDFKGMEDFYVSKDKTIPVKLMKTCGDFRSGNLESLNSQIIEFPYENNRYSFIVLLPNEKDGLSKLIENLQPVDLQMIQANLKEPKLLTIKLPKFEAEETSRSESTLKKLGLKKIFSPFTSDLGDLSEDNDLHVEEIVQHVNIRVDEGAASKNALSATNPSGSKNFMERSQTINDELIIINRPFLYFVLDKVENFVLVGGKISVPEIKEEFGVSDSFKE